MSTKSFMVIHKIMNNLSSKLSPEYISGFVDGEGCFGLQFRKDIRHKRLSTPVYYSWKAQFTICARKDELELFKRIKDYFGCGNIYNELDKEIHYCVSKIEELENIISPFFKKYQLQGKKKFDFILWAEAIKIILRNKKLKTNVQKGLHGFQKTNWNENDLVRLLEIHTEMQKYKSKRPIGFKHINMAKKSA